MKSGGIPPPPVEKAAVALVENRVFLMGGNCGDSGDSDRGIQIMQGLFELDLEVRGSRLKMRPAKIGGKKNNKGMSNLALKASFPWEPCHSSRQKLRRWQGSRLGGWNVAGPVWARNRRKTNVGCEHPGKNRYFI